MDHLVYIVGAILLSFGIPIILSRRARAIPLERYLHVTTYDWEKGTDLRAKLEGQTVIKIPAWVFRDQMSELVDQGKVECKVESIRDTEGDTFDVPWFRLAPTEK